jgi:hypothetical protein
VIERRRRIGQVLAALAQWHVVGGVDDREVATRGAVVAPLAGHVIWVLGVAVVEEVVRPGVVRVEGEIAHLALRLQLQRIVV